MATFWETTEAALQLRQTQAFAGTCGPEEVCRSLAGMAHDCAAVEGRLERWSQSGVRLLDLRHRDSFIRRRLPNSATLPLSDLHQECCQLPPRERSFAVLLPACPCLDGRGCGYYWREPSTKEHTAEHKQPGHGQGTRRGKSQVAIRPPTFSSLCASLASERSEAGVGSEDAAGRGGAGFTEAGHGRTGGGETIVCGDILRCFLSSTNPWTITHAFLDSSELWAAAKARKILVENKSLQEAPPSHLWSPAPVLEESVAALEALLGEGCTPCAPDDHRSSFPSKLEPGDWRRGSALEGLRALDLGCGSGRDACYLAMRGWEVEQHPALPSSRSTGC